MYATPVMHNNVRVARIIPRLVLVIALSAAIACGRHDTPLDHTALATTLTKSGGDSLRSDSIARARQDSTNRSLPGYVVDSILPVEEQLRRFRIAVGGEPVTRLNDGSPSRDALVRRFLRAVVAADSIELVAMAVTSREFADLVYPESPNIHPPYQQDPSLVWRMIQNPSASGLKRLVRRAGGIEMKLRGYSCNPSPVVQGANRFWSACQLQLVDGNGVSSTHRFFGSIVE
ncbi:MAG: hypothetical protein ABIT38_18100, partial [Gemmatimonadaceae bacterium]